MPMTYSDANASIFNNDWFRGRVRTATSNYTNYLLNTPVEDPEHAAKVSAGQRLATTSEHVVQTLMFTLSGDPEVQAAGPAIPDATLQVLCEKVINLFWPVTPVVMLPLAMQPHMMPPPPPTQ